MNMKTKKIIESEGTGKTGNVNMEGYTTGYK